MTVNMSISDNLLLSSITVYLDDYNTPYKTWTTEEIESIIAENGEFTFDIAGDSTSAHRVKIVSVDAAGNEQVKEITDFFVTTNIWVRYYNNKGLFFGSIGGVILLAGLIVFWVGWKKKKISKEISMRKVVRFNPDGLTLYIPFECQPFGAVAIERELSAILILNEAVLNLIPAMLRDCGVTLQIKGQ